MGMRVVACAYMHTHMHTCEHACILHVPNVHPGVRTSSGSVHPSGHASCVHVDDVGDDDDNDVDYVDDVDDVDDVHDVDDVDDVNGVDDFDDVDDTVNDDVDDIVDADIDDGDDVDDDVDEFFWLWIARTFTSGGADVEQDVFFAWAQQRQGDHTLHMKVPRAGTREY
jgi:hypothetical protein